MRRNQGGFTLIELIVVIVIIGILAVVAVPAFIGLQDEARAGATKGMLGVVRSAVTLGYAKNAAGGTVAFPTTISGTLFSENAVPKNPITGANSVAAATGTGPGTTAALVGTGGWVYNNTNGRVWANISSSTIDAFTDAVNW